MGHVQRIRLIATLQPFSLFATSCLHSCSFVSAVLKSVYVFIERYLSLWSVNDYPGGELPSKTTYKSSSSSSSFISDTGSIEITIKQHRGQTGNIQKYTQNDRSNAETERDKDRNKKHKRIKNNCT